jgi:hypothetical protein
MDFDTSCLLRLYFLRKILSALDNYEVNTGKVHPFAVKRNESGLGTRGAGVPLTTYKNENWMAEISIGTPPRILKGKFSLYSSIRCMFTLIYVTVQIDTGSA